MTDTRRYPAQVFWSDEDEGYIAIATDLPGCSAFGDSQDEALLELQHAISAWIEAQRSAGNRIPQPSSPSKEHSGKVLVRMPRALHASLALNAKTEDVSLNHYIVYLLSVGNERHSTSSAARLAIWAGANITARSPFVSTSNVDLASYSHNQWPTMLVLGLQENTAAPDTFRRLAIWSDRAQVPTWLRAADFAENPRTSRIKEKTQVDRDG